MIRLGLCCIFREQPIKFSTTTAAAIGRMPRDEGRAKLARLCMANADALLAALQFCAEQGIGCFRIISQILPLATHPAYGYKLQDLPDGRAIIRRFKQCGKFARNHDMRTCFHPDQFVVLNSGRSDVVEASLQELEYQAEIAGWVGADVINIHAGGAFGDKEAALRLFAQNVKRLSRPARKRLTVENDDRLYTPADLLPICKAEGIPLVYDVHHHRCNLDGLTVEEATQAAIGTWDREPLFHLSSPIDGWKCANRRCHHDYIALRDFPACWRNLDVTVEVEAKAKELAVLKLKRVLGRKPRRSAVAR